MIRNIRGSWKKTNESLTGTEDKITLIQPYPIQEILT